MGSCKSKPKERELLTMVKCADPSFQNDGTKFYVDSTRDYLQAREMLKSLGFNCLELKHVQMGNLCALPIANYMFYSNYPYDRWKSL